MTGRQNRIPAFNGDPYLAELRNKLLSKHRIGIDIPEFAGRRLFLFKDFLVPIVREAYYKLCSSDDAVGLKGESCVESC